MRDKPIMLFTPHNFFSGGGGGGGSSISSRGSGVEGGAN
jgi:hypothetical protein